MRGGKATLRWVTLSTPTSGLFGAHVEAQRASLWEPETPRTSCDLLILVDQLPSTESTLSGSRTWQIQPVEAFDSTSSVNTSEGFFQL